MTAFFAFKQSIKRQILELKFHFKNWALGLEFLIFCQRPLARDQGIIWVTVNLLFFSIFIFKGNLSEKNIPSMEFNSPARLSTNWATVTWYSENYLFNLRISKTMPQTLSQSWLEFLICPQPPFPPTCSKGDRLQLPRLPTISTMLSYPNLMILTS